MVKIGFRVDGSSKIGMGHIMRCTTLARYYINQGDLVYFFCSEAHTSGGQWLEQQGYSVILMKKHSIETEALALTYLINKDKINILFIDSYELNDLYFQILYNARIFTVVIDDDELFDYHCDVIINNGNKSDIITYNNAVVSKKLLGSNYALIRPEFTEISPAKQKDNVEKILVTMGGADVNNFTPVVLTGLKDFKNIEIVVLYAPLMKNIVDIEKAKQKCKGNVTIIQSPSNVAMVMNECDMAVAAGGGTVLELFTLGVVPLFVIQAQNQMPLVRDLEKKKLPLYLGYWDAVKPLMIKNAVAVMMHDNKLRKEIRNKIMQYAPQNGCENIYKEVKDLYMKKVNQ